MMAKAAAEEQSMMMQEVSKAAELRKLRSEPSATEFMNYWATEWYLNGLNKQDGQSGRFVSYC